MANNVTTHHPDQATGWVGWIGFATVLLGLAGIFHILAGFVALFQEDVYLAFTRSVWVFDYSQWGWIHIAGGVLALLAASSLLRGGAFGRVFAAVIAMFSALANMAFIPIYPIWALVIITIDVLVLWAVTVHGDEMSGFEE